MFNKMMIKWILLFNPLLINSSSHSDEDILNAIVKTSQLFDTIPTSKTSKQCYLNHYTNCTKCLQDPNCQYIRTNNWGDYFQGGLCLDKLAPTTLPSNQAVFTSISDCSTGLNSTNQSDGTEILLQLRDLSKLAQTVLPNAFKQWDISRKVELLNSIYSIDGISQECRAADGLGASACVCPSNGTCAHLKFKNSQNQSLNDCVVNVPPLQSLISDHIDTLTDCKLASSSSFSLSEVQIQIDRIIESSRYKSDILLMSFKVLSILSNFAITTDKQELKDCSKAITCSECLEKKKDCSIYTFSSNKEAACLPKVTLPAKLLMLQTKPSCPAVNSLSNEQLKLKQEMLNDIIKIIETDFIGSLSEKVELSLSAYQMQLNGENCISKSTCEDCLSSGCSYIIIPNQHPIFISPDKDRRCILNSTTVKSNMISFVTNCSLLSISNDVNHSITVITSSSVISGTALFILIPIAFFITMNFKWIKEQQPIGTNWITFF